MPDEDGGTFEIDQTFSFYSLVNALRQLMEVDPTTPIVATRYNEDGEPTHAYGLLGVGYTEGVIVLHISDEAPEGMEEGSADPSSN